MGADRVRDHCHLTGKFRVAAHNDCNLNYNFTGRIPVILHNLHGYDSHLIMQGLGKLKDKNINCIPNNTENYISLSIEKLDFIHSLQFMNASLDKLVYNLAKDGADKFHILEQHIDSDKVHLLLRKGVYPNDHMDCVERFEEPALPPKEAFYSVWNDEHILDANNLYGWAMSQPLPTGEFDWLTDQEIADLDVTDVADDNEQGYILEVDLQYPSELHDFHNDYRLAPEKMKISSEMRHHIVRNC